LHASTKHLAFSAPGSAEQLAAAQRLIASGRLDEAEALLAELLERRPDEADALNAFGGIALARKDGERASVVLGADATAFPDHAGLVNNLGIAHQMCGRLAEAVLCFERAVALAPGSDGPLQSLATARFMSNDFEGARPAAEEIVTLT
jgi:Flp pilus assembly protein TadD